MLADPLGVRGNVAVLPEQGRGDSQLALYRPKRGPDLFRAYHVKVDGAEIGEIRRGETRVCPLSAGRHEVHLEIDWCRSPSVSVEAVPGEPVNLVCYPRFRAWQSRKALATPDEYLVLIPATDGDG
jgi:hypothetical protein